MSGFDWEYATETDRTPNDSSTRLTPFVAKVYDNAGKECVPIYTPYDATDTTQGITWLTDDASSGKNALSGMTATTPKAVKSYVDSNALLKNSTGVQNVTGTVNFSSVTINGDDITASKDVSVDDIVGTLPVSKGGTGVTSIDALKKKLGLESLDFLPTTGGTVTGVVSIESDDSSSTGTLKMVSKNMDEQNEGTNVEAIDGTSMIRFYRGTGDDANEVGRIFIGNDQLNYTHLKFMGTRMVGDVMYTQDISVYLTPTGKGGINFTDNVLSSLRSSMGFGTGTGALGVRYGGTGATAKYTAKRNLGITMGTDEPSSSGSAGDIYFQY